MAGKLNTINENAAIATIVFTLFIVFSLWYLITGNDFAIARKGRSKVRAKTA
jgi:hypothetical protein